MAASATLQSAEAVRNVQKNQELLQNARTEVRNYEEISAKQKEWINTNGKSLADQNKLLRDEITFARTAEASASLHGWSGAETED